MKKFNVVDALKGMPVITRGGKQATIAACNSSVDFENRVIGWVDGKPTAWYMDGRLYENQEDSLDLFMKDDCAKEICCKCTCNRSVCLTDPLSGSLQTRSTKFVLDF